MLFFVHYEGKEYRVGVEVRRGRTYLRMGDGTENPVDISFYGQDCTIIHKGRVFSANVLGEKTEYSNFHPRGNMHFQVESENRRIVGLLRGQVLTNENNVYAKMPGKIAKLAAKVGAEVSVGDPVLVMEAMKMENEIRCAVAGRIVAVHVKDGQAVETGTLLVEIEPA